MEKIKFGDIQYFTLLRLQTTLKSFDFSRLPLNSYDKLKLEVDMAVETINYQANERAKEIKKQKRQFDFWCSCIVYHHPKEMVWFKVCPVCDKRINSKITR